MAKHIKRRPKRNTIPPLRELPQFAIMDNEKFIREFFKNKLTPFVFKGYLPKIDVLLTIITPFNSIPAKRMDLLPSSMQSALQDSSKVFTVRLQIGEGIYFLEHNMQVSPVKGWFYSFMEWSEDNWRLVNKIYKEVLEQKVKGTKTNRVEELLENVKI